jgi:hypothetical protein
VGGGGGGGGGVFASPLKVCRLMDGLAVAILGRASGELVPVVGAVELSLPLAVLSRLRERENDRPIIVVADRRGPLLRQRADKNFENLMKNRPGGGGGARGGVGGGGKGLASG